MLLLPVETAPLMKTLQSQITSTCTLEKGVLNVPQWNLTEVVSESLRILLSLNCIPGDMSVSRLATTISKGDYAFDKSIMLI